MNLIDDAEYIRLGKKAREQSLRFAIENLQMQLDELLSEDHPSKPAATVIGRKKGKGWAEMTAEERSLEMKRRRAVQAGLAPSVDPRHLEQQRRYRAKPKLPAKSWWTTASAAQKKKRIAVMNKARLAKMRVAKKPNGAAVTQ